MYNKKYISGKKSSPAARFGNSLRDMFIDTVLISYFISFEVTLKRFLYSSTFLKSHKV